MNVRDSELDDHKYVCRLRQLFVFLDCYMIIFFITMMMSCSQKQVVAPVDYFRSKHPKLSAKYITLNPTSYESIFNCWRFHCLSTEMLIDNIIQGFPNCEELNNYLLKIKELQDKECSDKIKSLKKFKRMIEPTDHLYDFEYKDGQIEESGLIIINISGDIKYREVSISNRNWGKSGSLSNSITREWSGS